MVYIVHFDVLVLIRLLKHDRYSSNVIKLVNNQDVMYVCDFSLAKISHTMCCLKIAKL